MPTLQQQGADLVALSANRLPEHVVAAFSAERKALREQGVPSGTIAAGDTLTDFTLPDATGADVSLSQVLADGPAVLVFYRGGWCPYCNLALRAYQAELLPELTARGVRLVAFSPQSPDESLSTQEKAQLSFTLLSDARSRVARRLGISFQPAETTLAAQRELGLDLAVVNANGVSTLPMPTVLVVDPDRTVRFADTQPDYVARTEVADILAALPAA